MVQVNLYTCDTVEKVEQYFVEKPAEIGPNDDRLDHVDVIDIQTDLLMLSKEAKMEYINEEVAERDGIPVVRNDSLTAKDTSVFAFSSESFAVSVHDHRIDAYPIFQDVFTQFGLRTTKDGNDFLVGDSKLFGVANSITGGWMAGGQLRSLSFDPSPYIDLPDEKFVDKETNNVQQRVGSIDEFTPDDVTPTARHATEALEAVLNDEPISLFSE